MRQLSKIRAGSAILGIAAGEGAACLPGEAREVFHGSSLQSRAEWP